MGFEGRMGRRAFLRNASFVGVGVGMTAAISGAVEIAGQAITIVQNLESTQQHFVASEVAVRVGQTEEAERKRIEGYQQVGVVNHIARDGNPRSKTIGGAIVSVASLIGLLASSETR